jgi:hypothetical protein
LSALYGCVSGDGRAQDKTRCAHRETVASAQSYSGSITVTLTKDGKDAAPEATIQVADGSDMGGRTLWSGPLADLLNATRLVAEPKPEAAAHCVCSDLSTAPAAAGCRVHKPEAGR